jgi:predicted secreted protein
VENSQLSQGDTVNLTNNPLGTTSVNVYIPQLEEERVDVKYFKLHIDISCFMFKVYQHIAKEVELATGDLFTVILCSNRTTGFQWLESAQIDDQSVLEQQAHRFVPPEENTPGTAGKEVWTFKALKQGSSDIYMEYSRPWEDGEKREWTCTINVIVK